MAKMIINKGAGSFRLSREAYRLYAQKKGITLYEYEARHPLEDIAAELLLKKIDPDSSQARRWLLTKDFGSEVKFSLGEITKYVLVLGSHMATDPTLIEVVHELQERASAPDCDLVVVDINFNAFMHRSHASETATNNLRAVSGRRK